MSSGTEFREDGRQGDGPGFLANRRDRTTRRSVLIADRVADWTIRIGGIGVIVAVVGIMLFLVQVIVPLFLGGSLTSSHEFAKARDSGAALMARIDEYRTLAVLVADSGRVTATHVGTGSAIEAPSFDLGGRKVTAFARTLSGEDIAFGFADGTLRFGRLVYRVQILTPEKLPANLRPLNAKDRSDGLAIYSAIAGDQFRKISVEIELGEPETVAEPDAAIVAVYYILGGTVERPSRSFVTVDSKGIARISRAETRINLMTGQRRTTIETSTLPELPAGIRVRHLLMNDKADQVYIAEQSGMVYRFDTRDLGKPVMAERVDLFPGDTELTVLGYLNGEQSIIVGGSDGTVDVYFRLQREKAETKDGFQLVRAHRLEPHARATSHMAASQRTKTLITADAAGAVLVRHTTSEQTLLRLAPADGPVAYDSLVLAPRDDAILAVGRDGKARVWEMAVPHPETTIASIFGKVWYEGYPEPNYTWQSSAATDSFEPKLSLVPLIFGTIKAAAYSLLFAIPIALLGAIYTSEFLHPDVRSRIKPVIEVMASLPSVVLGFISALILAPLVETWIAAVLLTFVAIPVGLLAAAFAWQFLPRPLALQYGGVPKFLLISLVLAGSLLLAYAGGGGFERLFFAGDFKAWVNGRVGSAAPFLFLLLFPVTFLAADALRQRWFGDQLADLFRSLPSRQAAALSLAQWLGLLAAAGVGSWVLASLLAAFGMDARGGLVDTYVQRNTLVVGFAMGFAVIPIIYTIAEDALNSVPEHLRAASLACGATPWQTAISVILPTAASGVFAAIMVGMGRAVGETMIVVMAAGNTPVLEWNVFSGLRALSANIAVELPEAVKDSSLYRMLFLAALTLFVMTFVINTAAESIRLRFRKRAAQL